MGMNAVIVILTDELDRIETDKEFGQKLYWAIKDLTNAQAGTVQNIGSYGSHVVSNYHADLTQLVQVDRNLGRIVEADNIKLSRFKPCQI